MNIDLAASITALVFVLGLAYHAGVEKNKLADLRRKVDEEAERNREFRHQTIERVSGQIDSLKILILRVIPQKDWPQDL